MNNPTHQLPPFDHKTIGVIVAKGQSIPSPASTKRLLYGPSFLAISGGHVFEEFDLDLAVAL